MQNVALAPTVKVEEDQEALAPAIVDPIEHLPFLEDDKGALPWRMQPLVPTDMSEIKVRIPDYAVGKKVRRLSTIGAVSKSRIYPWWERPDPYWETTLFDAQRSWRHSAKAGAIYNTQEYLYPIIDAGRVNEKPVATLSDIPVLTFGRLVGLLRQMGVASTEHLGAITNDQDVRDKLLTLSETGVIEGALHHAPGAGFPRIEMWRIRQGPRYATYAARCVDAGLRPEHFLELPVEGGLPGSRHSRHQTLATEIMLRALEVGSEWMGWLPEAVCLPERFLSRGHPLLEEERAAAELAYTQRKKMKNNFKQRSVNDYQQDAASVRADGVLVRVDGHKVFLELQAQKSTLGTRTKVANWSRLLDAGPVGGVVLFAVAAKRASLPSTIAEIKNIIATEASPKAQPYFLVGSWIDWMPEHIQTTADCGTLRCAQYKDDEWNEVHAANVEIPEPMPDWGLMGVMPSLGATPDWFMATEGFEQFVF